LPEGRLAQPSDLERLHDLFRASEVSSTAQSDQTEKIWSETLTRKGIAIFVSDVGSRIVATCMLITAPNLLRGGRAHGFLENVVTHPEFRGLDTVARSFGPHSPRLGQAIVTTSYSKAVAKIRKCIASMSVADLNREFGPHTLLTVRCRTCFRLPGSPIKSATGHLQTCAAQDAMPASPLKADVKVAVWKVCYGPVSDSHTQQAGLVRSVARVWPDPSLWPFVWPPTRIS
jgi:hypothetical protein